MELFNFKCKYCGGEMGEIEGLKSVGKCKYCGSKQTLPKLYDEKRATLFGRANHMRRNNEFDKAEALYEHILNEDPSDPEAYWSLVLCRFGIEYVEDANTKERKPTVNRTQMTSVFADENYKSAIKNADDEQKKLYEQEAKVINEIQKGILEISQNKEPFDVFICYKETNASGKRTDDSVLAYNVYRELSQAGYKVFYARETLSNKIGSEYEPYIFSALNSAKVMIVLGTKKEHLEAAWVRNEWSRFLGMIKNGEKKTVIPLYMNIDAYDLPQEFSNLQALDMSRIGYMQELLEGVDRIIKKYIKNGKTQINESDHSRPPQKDNKGKKIIIPLICLVLAIAIGISAFVVLNKNEPNVSPDPDTEKATTTVYEETNTEETAMGESTMGESTAEEITSEDVTISETTVEETTTAEEATTEAETGEQVNEHALSLNEVSENVYGTGGEFKGKKYTVSCTCGCGAVVREFTVSSNVNAYLSPQTLVARHGFQVIRSAEADTDYYYHAVHDGYIYPDAGLPTASQHIWLRERYMHPDGSDSLAGGGSEFTENINIGTAKYLTIKLRTNAFDTSGTLVDPIKLMISTTDWNYEHATAIDLNARGWQSVATMVELSPGESGVWTTFVVDLSIIGKHFAEDAEGGYVIDTLSLMQDDLLASSGSYLDIAYIAFVDSIIEARALADTETLTSISANKSESVVCKGECVDSDSNNRCDICGVDNSSFIPTKLNDGDGRINKILKVNDLIGPRDVRGAALNCTPSEKNGNLYIEMTSGMQYLWLRESYYLSNEDMVAQNGQLSQPIKAMGDNSTFEVGAARYMMIKLKTNLTANHYIRLSTTAFNYNRAIEIYQTGILADVKFDTTGDGNWTVFVIDLDAFGERGAVTDGYRSIDSFILTSGAVDGYLEIEYIAFADDWAEVVSYAGSGSTFKYVYESGKSTLVDSQGNAYNK